MCWFCKDKEDREKKYIDWAVQDLETVWNKIHELEDIILRNNLKLDYKIQSLCKHKEIYINTEKEYICGTCGLNFYGRKPKRCKIIEHSRAKDWIIKKKR